MAGGAAGGIWQHRAARSCPGVGADPTLESPLPFIRCLAAPARRFPLPALAFLALLVRLVEHAALAQDAAGPGQGETTAPQPTSTQRLEITGRLSATDLRRASRVAKQIYGREVGLEDTVTVVRFSQIVENPPDFQDRLRGVGGAQN